MDGANPIGTTEAGVAVAGVAGAQLWLVLLLLLLLVSVWFSLCTCLSRLSHVPRSLAFSFSGWQVNLFFLILFVGGSPQLSLLDCWLG